VGNVRQATQIKRVIAQAKQSGGIIAHTLVDDRLRRALIALARDEDVAAIDLMGPLLSRLESVLKRTALGQPGLYRQFHRAYFERVSAIEFTMAHDDGQQRAGWPQADMVLVGVSRSGKTPPACTWLCWAESANVPLVPGVPPRRNCWLRSPARIGPTIRPDQQSCFASSVCPAGPRRADRLHQSPADWRGGAALKVFAADGSL
jgi:regulator of PEP synthase PpsR (kinase-PPPase family)